MPNYDLTGSIKKLFDQVTFDSGFTKREFVVTSEDKFPQDIKFECVKEKCALLDGFKEGDRVTATFSIRGNEYKDRYYVNLQAWKLEAAADEGGAAAGGDGDRPPLPSDDMAPDEDMPF